MELISPLPIWMISVLAVAADANSKQPQWWEIATGILAIPATIVGLVYSILLIRKTNVEVRKTKLEILEKETALRKAVEDQTELSQALVTPIIESKNVQFFVYRFILLWIIILFWNFVEEIFNFLLSGILIGINNMLPFSGITGWVVLPFFLIQNLPKIGKVLILIGLGLPLLRDVSSILGINLNSLSLIWRSKHE